MIQYLCIHKGCDKVEETKVYEAKNFEEAYIADTMQDVVSILEERGYNPINQISSESMRQALLAGLDHLRTFAGKKAEK